MQRCCDSAEFFRIGDRVDAVDAALFSLDHDDDEGPSFGGEYDRWGTVQLGLVQERIGGQSPRRCDTKTGHRRPPQPRVIPTPRPARPPPPPPPPFLATPHT